jgi:hypothetical protein
MKIEKAIEGALKSAPRTKQFTSQLELNRNFLVRMEQAGVVTRKQQFSIPLMERIANATRVD